MKLTRRWLVILTSCFLLMASAYAKNSLRFDIQGIQGDALKNVQTRLDLAQNAYDGDLSEEDIRTLFQQAPQAIKEALQPYGYFQTDVQSHLAQKGENWTASFTIHPGTRMKIASVDFQVLGQGKDNPELQRLANSLPLKRGDVFQTDVYQSLKEKVLQAANNEGFVNAYFVTNKILINTQSNDAAIVMHLETGHRYYFGQVTFADSPYDTTFLDRFVKLKENEAFSSQKLIRIQQNMAGSFYFKRVEITPDFKHADNYHVPVHITVEAQKSQKYNVGVGYGTFTGPRLTAGVSFRRVTSTGQHFDAQLRLSSILSGLAAKYYIPGRNPITDRWIIGANYQKFSPKHGKSISQSVSLGYTRKMHRLRAGLDLNYLIEKYSVFNKPTTTNSLLYPSLTLSYVRADSLINPQLGKSLNVTLQGSAQGIFSSTSFLQGDVKGKYLFSPFDFAHVIVRGELGYTVVHDLNNLPLSMRFFAGGLNSIRGYPDSSIGPGRYLQVGSFEYQNHIAGNWSGAAFYDFGMAGNSFDSPLKKGAGVGVVYQSMVGPAKLYLERAINKKGRPYSVEFSIGPEF